MEIFSSILIFSFGLIAGGLAVKFLMGNKTNPEVEDKIHQLENETLSLQKDKESLNERIKNSIDEFGKQRERERQLQEDKLELSGQLSASRTNLLNVEDKLATQRAELEQLQERFTKEFKLAADAILKQNSKEFSLSHQKELDQILNPLKEKIKSFEENVEKKYLDETKERASLKQEILQLVELNKTLNDQAENLTTALKGENKTQGNWGEVVLERILENSGLIKGEEYETQFSDTNNENKRIQPDVVIKLPEEKHIIIDAKVSLVAYERFIASEDTVEREGYLKAHVASIKNHVKGLGDKNYQSGLALNSPDFVLLFMPIEPAFSLAAQYDQDLFLYAWDRKVVLVSPTTLLATLRTIASVWKNERQTKNAQDIAQKAGNLYDKFKAFVDDMQKIEKGLNSAQNAYNDAFNKLSTGRGNLVGRAEKIKALGAKAEKSLPKELMEFDEKE